MATSGEEYEEEEYEEETEEEVDEAEEHEMESKIRALEAELVSLKDSTPAAPAAEPATATSAAAAPAQGEDSLIPDLLKNPALDTGSQFSKVTFNSNLNNLEDVNELKRNIMSLQNQLDALTTAHRNDLGTFRMKEEEMSNKIQTLEDTKRNDRDHISEIESRCEELLTKNAILENTKNKLESENRDLQRLVSGKEQNILGLEETKRQLEQRVFRYEQDNHSLETELQNTQWKLKTGEAKMEQESKEKTELDRQVQKLTGENQDLGLRILSVSGTTRVQQAEIENLHRDIRLANAEREESIKVAVSKNQMEQELLKIREEALEANRQINLQTNSLNQYKEECNRLNAEFAKAQRQAEQWRKELMTQEDAVSSLREENVQLKAVSNTYEKDIDRLNALLIDERKERYNKFAAAEMLEPSTMRHPGFSTGPTPRSIPVSSRYPPETRFGDARPKALSGESQPEKLSGDWNTLYGSDYADPVPGTGRGRPEKPAGGSSPFISRARSSSPGATQAGKEEHLGPYGRVFEMQDIHDNTQVSRSNFKAAPVIDTAQLEGKMMELNQERTALEATLMKYPTNSAGRTLTDRKNKQQAEARLLDVEKELSLIRGKLRSARTLL
ncbi:unnamed protein product [Amoebophrya sp. A120]|nr:unnamed protein product [Amoebophrya sp. A120]|eukprot:GSA120T00002537001.1